MKCKSCQGEVPPKFAHAISTNTCPLCGDRIMDEELQSALKSLGEAMRATEKYPSEVFDWLKSNFDLVKQSDIKVKQTTASKVAPKSDVNSNSSDINYDNDFLEEESDILVDSNGNQITGKVIQDSNVTDKFFKNAGVKQRSDKLKDLVKQIKKNVVHSSHENINALNAEEISGEDLARMRPEEIEQLESMMSGSISGPSSALSSGEDSYEDEIPSFVLNMANKNKNNSEYNYKDVLKLQELQRKSSQARSEISRTGGVGIIRR